MESPKIAQLESEGAETNSGLSDAGCGLFLLLELQVLPKPPWNEQEDKLMRSLLLPLGEQSVSQDPAGRSYLRGQNGRHSGADFCGLLATIKLVGQG